MSPCPLPLQRRLLIRQGLLISISKQSLLCLPPPPLHGGGLCHPCPLPLYMEVNYVYLPPPLTWRWTMSPLPSPPLHGGKLCLPPPPPFTWRWTMSPLPSPPLHGGKLCLLPPPPPPNMEVDYVTLPLPLQRRLLIRQGLLISISKQSLLYVYLPPPPFTWRWIMSPLPSPPLHGGKLCLPPPPPNMEVDYVTPALSPSKGDY